MSLKLFVEQAADTIRDKVLRKKSGPFYRDSQKLIFSLGRARETIRKEPNANVKAFLNHVTSNLPLSNSQIFQDLLVDFVLAGKRNGYFCEFGATNGVSLSNSYFLETQRGWTGICAEPARGWHTALRTNRPKAHIETNCVWSKTGEVLEFKEAKSGELSTLGDYAKSDGHSRKRTNAEAYQVTTISLNDMLQKYNAPHDFDFLSIDTEGSELEILKAFDFKKYQPKIMTIEHNYTPNRDLIHTLLTGHGYKRVLMQCSQFDDWYLAAGVELPA